MLEGHVFFGEERPPIDDEVEDEIVIPCLDEGHLADTSVGLTLANGGKNLAALHRRSVALERLKGWALSNLDYTGETTAVPDGVDRADIHTLPDERDASVFLCLFGSGVELIVVAVVLL